MVAGVIAGTSRDPDWDVELKGLRKRFGDFVALDGIDLQIRRGEFFGLLGPSGCGKTTLLRIIAGLEMADAGEVVIRGRPVGHLPAHKRNVNTVFQSYALFPFMTVEENVAFGLRMRGVRGEALRKRVAAALELVEIGDLAKRKPQELSGGQQQRVALARALAPKPSLILLDEPLSNLDVQVRYYLREEIRKILKQTQTSAIFVTHDQEEALCLSDWVAVMREGRIEQWGSPEEVYREPATRFVAEFIAQANFLRCERREFGWQAEGLLHIPFQALRDQPDPHLRQGELMIRQEELRLHPNPQGRVTIRDRQFLGREYRYCLVTETGKQLHALAREALPVGTRVQVTVEQGRLFPISEPQSVAGSGSKSFA